MKENYLFSKESLSDYLKSQSDSVRKQIESYSEGELFHPDFSLQIGQLSAKSIQRVPIINQNAVEFTDEIIEVENNPYTSLLGGKSKAKKISVFLPFDGNSDLFDYRTREYTSNPPSAKINGNELVFEYVVKLNEPENNIRSRFDEDLFNVMKYLEFVVKELTEFNQSLPTLINNTVASAKIKIENAKKTEQNLGWKRRD